MNIVIESIIAIVTIDIDTLFKSNCLVLLGRRSEAEAEVSDVAKLC